MIAEQFCILKKLNHNRYAMVFNGVKPLLTLELILIYQWLSNNLQKLTTSKMKMPDKTIFFFLNEAK